MLRQAAILPLRTGTGALHNDIQIARPIDVQKIVFKSRGHAHQRHDGSDSHGQAHDGEQRPCWAAHEILQ